jgi:chemotaxis protein MotB
MTRRSAAAPSVPWTITFADMALLLLCFFVMLSALSPKTVETTKAPAEAPQTPAAAINAATMLRNQFAFEIEQGWLVVNQTDSTLLLRFGAGDAFDLGSDHLTPLTRALIDTLAHTLRDGDARMIVAGHTDDLPISTERFRDNWDLSSARAVSVIRELINRHGVDPNRLEAKGYADTRPLVVNDSPANRARNRRIEIEITWEH